MGKISTRPGPATTEDLDRMHALYRQGGLERRMAPHIVHPEAACPHPDCGQNMQAIDFRLGDHGRAVHDPLVRAWWNDAGFAGRCPRCRGWIHFTLRAKHAITPEEAAGLTQSSDDWHERATIL